MQGPINFALPKGQETVQFREIRRMVQLLPNEALQHMRLIGQMIEQFRRRKLPIWDAQHVFQPLKLKAHGLSCRLLQLLPAAQATRAFGKLATKTPGFCKKNILYQ
jgi:hypothetical protein